jgi:hypothetical protein
MKTRHNALLSGPALLLATLALCTRIAGAAVIVGNDPIDRTISDGWAHFVLNLQTEVIPIDGTITGWEVFAANDGDLGLLVFDAGNRVVAAEARTVAAGLNSFTTSLAVSAGNTLGLWLGDARVDYDYNLGDFVSWCASNGCAPNMPAVGDVWVLPTQGDSPQRTYSVRATVVPEPGTVLLLGLALGAIGLRIRSRA